MQEVIAAFSVGCRACRADDRHLCSGLSWNCDSLVESSLPAKRHTSNCPHRLSETWSPSGDYAANLPQQLACVGCYLVECNCGSIVHRAAERFHFCMIRTNLKYSNVRPSSMCGCCGGTPSRICEGVA